MQDFVVKRGIFQEKTLDFGVKRGILKEKMHDLGVKRGNSQRKYMIFKIMESLGEILPQLVPDQIVTDDSL